MARTAPGYALLILFSAMAAVVCVSGDLFARGLLPELLCWKRSKGSVEDAARGRCMCVWVVGTSAADVTVESLRIQDSGSGGAKSSITFLLREGTTKKNP